MVRAFVTVALAAALLAVVACEPSVTEPDRPSAAFETVTARAATEGNALANNNAQLAAIQALQSAFHGALNASDYDAIHSLWTSDATLAVGPTTASGRDEIAEFFRTSGPFVNGWAALAPSYKSTVEIEGNTASFGFECVYLADSGNLTGQTVVAHLNATGTMRKVGDRWLFQHFQGGAGPL